MAGVKGRKETIDILSIWGVCLSPVLLFTLIIKQNVEMVGYLLHKFCVLQ